MKYLITIIGPTAIGKTALSIKLAQQYDCEIVSADSRQFYREMTIGTAVPEPDELAAAKHHFIQHKSVFEDYNVGDFEKDAVIKLNQLFKENDYAILVGGSGLYIDAVLNGLDNFPEVSDQVRELVRANYQKHGIEYLQQQLEELDNSYFAQVKSENPQTLLNPQRLMRFVEVSLATGQPYSTFLNQPKEPRIFSPIIIGLQADRNLLYSRIDDRVDIMMGKGLMEEAESLYSQKHLNALQTVGYRELFSFLDKEISIETAVSEIKKNSRRFAKRQMTWLKRYEHAKWFQYDSDLSVIVDHITSVSTKC